MKHPSSTNHARWMQYADKSNMYGTIIQGKEREKDLILAKLEMSDVIDMLVLLQKCLQKCPQKWDVQL
jgi:hypothetical protein